MLNQTPVPLFSPFFSFEELLTSLLKFVFQAPAHPCKKNEDCDVRATCHRGKCRCVGKTTGNGKYCRGNMVKRNIVKSTVAFRRAQRKKQNVSWLRKGHKGVKSAYESSDPSARPSYPGFRSIKRLGLLLHPGWDAGPSQRYLQC